MLNHFQTAGALCLALCAATAFAQDYPSKPIRMIVPNAPAGLADISARIVAVKLAEALGQAVVVDNRAGAGSTIGTAMAVKAPADGYTLLTVFDSHATNPHLFKNLDYDTLKDLAPISLLVRGPLLLAINPKTGFKSTQELVQAALEQVWPVIYQPDWDAECLRFFYQSSGLQNLCLYGPWVYGRPKEDDLPFDRHFAYLPSSMDPQWMSQIENRLNPDLCPFCNR